jgi:hypothetical protein
LKEELHVEGGVRQTDGVVATVVVDSYPGGTSGRMDRSHLRESAETFLRTARVLGFDAEPLRAVGEGDPAGGVLGTTRADIAELLRRLREHPAERKIVYWTGHGVKSAGMYRLACQDSFPDDRFETTMSIAAAELVEWLAKDTADIVLILDACFAGRVMADAFRFIHESGRGPDRDGRPSGFALVVTADGEQEAAEGRWAAFLREVVEVTDLDLDGHRLFHREQPYVPFQHLMSAVAGRARRSDQQCTWNELTPLRAGFLYNPYCSQRARPARRPAGDETWLGDAFRAETMSVVATRRERWALRDFTPRQAVLGSCVTWLTTQNTGLLAVTGASGSGKSALLGYLAQLTTRAFWADLPADRRPRLQPDLHSIHAAIHCAGKTLGALVDEVRRRLAALGLDPPAGYMEPAESCVADVAELARAKGSLTLLFDGLDESAPGHALDIARRLLNRLAAQAGVKVLVGTRMNPRRVLPGTLRQETLLDALHHSRPPLELDRDAEDDIFRHVEELLARSPSPYAPADHADGRHRTARYVAANSGQLFLRGTLWARRLAAAQSIASDEELGDQLSGGMAELDQLFSAEIDRLDANDPDRTRDLLRPLALAQGRGLPADGLWLALTNAVKPWDSRQYNHDDLVFVVRAAGGVLIAGDNEFGRTVYRLDHPSFGAYVLGDGADPAELHARMCRALARYQQKAGASGGDPVAVPYADHYLAAHAALAGGGALRELMDEDEFLVRSSPDILEPLVASQLAAEDKPALYLRVADAFRTRTSPHARWSLLRATALATAPEMLRWIERPPEIFWQDVWSSADVLPAQRSRPGPHGGAYAVFWEGTGPAGGVIHAAGSGHIRSWTAAGKELHGRDTGPATWHAPPRLDGVTVVGRDEEQIVAAHDGRTLYLWHANEPRPSEQFFWGGSLRSLCGVSHDGWTYLAAADRGRLWVWRWPGGQPYRIAKENALQIAGDAAGVALLPLPDAVLAAVGGLQGVTFWDVTRRRSRPGTDAERIGGPLATDRPVQSVAVLMELGTGAARLASLDGAELRLWTLPDPLSPSRPDPVFVTGTSGHGLSLGPYEDGVLVGVREDLDVRVWSFRGDTGIECTSLPGDSGLASLAFDPLGSGRLAVADAARVRLWEPPLPVGAAGGAPDPSRAYRRVKGKALIAMATGGDGRHLLCRALGGHVLVSLHTADGPVPGERPVLPVGERVTAVAAAAVPDGWLVVTVSGRSVAFWRIPRKLSTAPSAPCATLDLRGRADQSVASVALHTEQDGSGRLFAPANKQGVLAWECADPGVYCVWRELPGVWHLPGAAMAQQVTVGRLSGGPLWLYAWGGADARVWRLPGNGPAAHEVDAEDVRAAAFGLLSDDGAEVGLVAVIRGGGVELAECHSAYPGPERLDDAASGDTVVDRLAFAGPARHPVLLGWASGGGKVRIWDVRNRRAVGDIEDRGYQVEEVATVHDRAGITLMLQGRAQGGRVRCDQVLLPAPWLAASLGAGPHVFNSSI